MLLAACVYPHQRPLSSFHFLIVPFCTWHHLVVHCQCYFLKCPEPAKLSSFHFLILSSPAGCSRRTSSSAEGLEDDNIIAFCKYCIVPFCTWHHLVVHCQCYSPVGQVTLFCHLAHGCPLWKLKGGVIDLYVHRHFSCLGMLSVESLPLPGGRATGCPVLPHRLHALPLWLF